MPRKRPVGSRFDAQAAAVKDKSDLAAICRNLEQEKAAALAELGRQQQAEEMRQTYIGRLGAAVEPVMRPLGFDWRMSVSLITGFVAKEIVVSTLGVLYEAGEGTSETLQQALKASGLSAAAALAFMVFVLLYTPCLATVVTLWRESGAVKWMLFSVSYQLILAWSAAWVVLHLGRLAGLG